MERSAVAALFVVLLTLLGNGVVRDGLTNDEVLYIAAGHRHLTAGDYRFNPNHPPLAKLLSALPVALVQPASPGLDLAGGELAWAFDFVFRANAPGVIVPLARAPVVLVTLLLAALVWWWARVLFGPAGGLVALTLFAFHPTVLAHGHLATTDMPAAAIGVLAAWCFWRWDDTPTTGRAIAVAVALAAALVTRLTGGLLLPAFVVVAVLRLMRARGDAGARRARIRATVLLAAALALIVPVVIWAVYGFRYAPWPDATVLGPMRPRFGLASALVGMAASVHALPEAFLESIRYQAEHNTTGHPGFLLGARGKTGWWSYPLVAFAVKNTLVFVAGTLLAAAYWIARRRSAGPWLLQWALPAALIFLAASATRIQIGERYLLGAYPFLILLMAGAAALLVQARQGRRLVLALLALHALPVLAAAPRGHLAFFNLAAGGPSGGHRVLLDSNLDWGQDLPRLAAWMRREGVSMVQLGYHGADDPDRHGVAREDLPGLHLHAPHPPARPFSGVVAVSPNLLFGLVPRLGDPYAALRERPPDARAGVFFIYRLP